MDDAVADYGNYSGMGFVGSIDYQTSKVTFTIDVAENGNYPLNVGYAIGTTFGTATFNIYVNNSFYTTISLSKKNGWGSFKETSPLVTSINLYEGTNKVDFVKGYNYAELDYIDIGKRTGPFVTPSVEENEIKKVPEGFTRYEAENGKITSGVLYKTGSFSGMGYVGSLNNDYCYVEIPLTVEEDGEYQIKMAYACVEENASLKLYSGTYGRGGNVYFYKEEFFTNVSEDWGIFDENTIVTTSICLKKGKSFILVRSGLIRAEIDYIDLGQKIGDYYEGTYDETLDRNNKGAN